MSNRAERFVVLPFAIGCASEASVGLGNPLVKKQCEEPKTTSGSSSLTKAVKRKNGFMSYFSLPRPNISGGIQRLFRSLKSLSHIFVYKEVIEEPEKDMEIGFPTDVKHVTHIGLDGSKTFNPVKGWENINININPPELISFPSISLKQFEIAMAAQSYPQQQPVVDNNVVTHDSKA